MKTRIALAALLAAIALARPAYATLTSTSNTVSYTGNAVTTSFTVPFKFLQSSDLVVTIDGATKTLGADYSVRNAGNATGSVIFSVAPGSGTAVVITRSVALTQGTSLRQSRTFDPATLENALDKLTMAEQDTRAMQAIRDTQQDITTAANLAAAVATQAARDATQDTALTSFINTQSARDAAQNLALAQGATGGNGTMVVPTGTSFGRTLADTFADQVSVRSFTGVTGNGVTDDAPGILAACNATTGRRLYFPAGTYRISTVMVCNSGSIWFEAGAQLSIDSAKSFTASGRVVSLGGDPSTGAGTMIYSKDGNFFANDNGFSFSKTPSTGTDDFFHIRRDIQGSTGIIIRNDDSVGTLTDSYIHLYGGPLTGGSQGSNLRFSAGNLANNGGLVNIVAQHDAAFSLIQADAKPINIYTANVQQFQFGSVASAVNYGIFKGGAAGSSINYSVGGTDTNISVIYETKGTGSHFWRTNGAIQAEVFDTGAATNRLRLSGGANPTITTSGGNLTIGAPLAGTSGTFNSGVSITGGGLSIGPAGTSPTISGSYAGSASWTPGTVGANSCVTNAISAPGALVGSVCMIGLPGSINTNTAYCVVTNNTCTISVCNASAAGVAAAAGFYLCRVFNP